jgi:methylated-DNA-protein-cysteine methyltransferase-like protein
MVKIIKINSLLQVVNLWKIVIKLKYTLKIKEDNFFERVYEVARKIPYGKVTSYGAIAKALGAGRSARMVGWAMNACHGQDDIPAHRVVNRLGLLTGKHHFEGTNLMQQLLESEGIQVIDNQIIDFKKHFWEPDF